MVSANLSYNYQRTKVTGIRNMRNSTANQLLLDKQKLQLLEINLNKNVRKWGKEKHLNLFFYPFLKLHLVTNLKDRDVLNVMFHIWLTPYYVFSFGFETIFPSCRAEIIFTVLELGKAKLLGFTTKIIFV